VEWALAEISTDEADKVVMGITQLPQIAEAAVADLLLLPMDTKMASRVELPLHTQVAVVVELEAGEIMAVTLEVKAAHRWGLALNPKVSPAITPANQAHLDYSEQELRLLRGSSLTRPTAARPPGTESLLKGQ
tara:strand:+ start:203 stop:601 length:399 start_codon:yes stop_codon:yes gene_type:complete